MAIVKQYHKETDTTYVYESTSYWDPEKKQSRSKRHVIGKIDPVSGEIIPTGKSGRKRKEKDETVYVPDPAKDEQIVELSLKAAEYTAKISELEKENRKLRECITEIGKHVSRCAEIYTTFTEEKR